MTNPAVEVAKNMGAQVAASVDWLAGNDARITSAVEIAIRELMMAFFESS